MSTFGRRRAQRPILRFLLAAGCAALTSCADFLTDDPEHDSTGTFRIEGDPVRYPTGCAITWTRFNNDHFSAYRIYYDTVPDVSEKSTAAVTRYLRNDTSAVIGWLKPDRTYWIRVYAFDGISLHPTPVVEIALPTCEGGIPSRETSGSMVRIPAGCFFDSAGAAASLSGDFWMDTTEISNALWRSYMPEADSLFPNMPHNKVSWYEAVLFCNARSRAEGLDTCYSWNTLIPGADGIDTIAGIRCSFTASGFRLPTEDEWEYAARAGATTDLPWNRDIYGPDGGGVVYPVTSNENAEVSIYARWVMSDSSTRSPIQSASLTASRFGLYDMLGNLQEWVWDLHTPTRNPSNRLDGVSLSADTTGKDRIYKGGSFLSSIQGLYPGSRGTLKPNNGDLHDIGFRTVRKAY